MGFVQTWSFDPEEGKTPFCFTWSGYEVINILIIPPYQYGHLLLAYFVSHVAFIKLNKLI